MNNNRIYGYNRDKLIVETIEKFKCLDAEQIEILLFRETCNSTSAKIQSQNRLRKLSVSPKDKPHIKPKLNRWRMDLDESYKYYIKDFDQKEHIVLLNWMLIHYLIKHPFEKIYHMEYQRDYKILIPDLFLVTHNEFSKQYKAIFFEMDKTVSNKFDKIEKYNKLFDSKPNDEYVRLTAPHFPKLIIATTEISRLAEIFRLTKSNKNKLTKIDVNLIWKIQEECKNEMVTNFKSKFINDTDTITISLC